jgi:hypothetical protein
MLRLKVGMPPPPAFSSGSAGWQLERPLGVEPEGEGLAGKTLAVNGEDRTAEQEHGGGGGGELAGHESLDADKVCEASPVKARATASSWI